MKKKRNRFSQMTDTNMLLVITVAVFFLMYIGAVVLLGEGFTSPQTFLNLLNENAYLIILSCGLSIVMITGGIDISVGGVTALISMSCAVFIEKSGGSVGVAIFIALGIGLAFGLVQGFLISYLDIQPFIVTLAGMLFARGMTTIVNNTNINVSNEAFMKVKDTRITVPFMGNTNRHGIYIDGYIEIGAIIALIIVVILFVLLRWTRQGRNLYAVGGNPQSALMLGINVQRTKFMAYIATGLLTGIGGFVYFLHIGSGAASNALGAEMNAIASSIIGGTMLSGGVGNIIGTLFGVLSLGTIKNIVTSAGLDDAWWTGITVAAMLCIFLVVQSVIIAKKKKAAKQ